MDAISIGIIVTVLTLGSALVFLFKKEYENRQKPGQVFNSISKKTNKHHDTKTSAQKLTSNVKQVPSTNATSNQVQNNTHKSATISSVKKIPDNSSGLSHPSLTSQAHPDSNALNTNHPQTKVTKKREVPSLAEPKIESELKKAGIQYESRASLEPVDDELDSSIPFRVFGPSMNKIAKTVVDQSSNNSHKHVEVEKVIKRRKTKLAFGDNTVDKILNIISSSPLSHDEIELTIEALLTKLESGDSNWRQPKNDPFQKLKNQLRDTEAALNMETSNHELTRRLLSSLKTQINNEELDKNRAKKETLELQKELSSVHRLLEQNRAELNKYQILHKQLKEESSQVIGKLEQEKAHLQALIGNANSLKDGEFSKLRAELEDKSGQVQRYELSNQAMSETIQDLEVKLGNVEVQLDQTRQSRQQSDFEARTRITELESEKLKFEKSVQDHALRLKEVSENNNLLEKSINELQLINSRQEEMLKRLRDERHINEASMKRTLCEMEQELKELQTKLSANTAINDDKLRKELSQAEVELNNAGQREKKLLSEMKELRDGLSHLLPEHIKLDNTQAKPSDWIQHYLSTVKQLALTVEELKEMNNNVESPSKHSVDKSTLTLPANGTSSRTSSPTSNGRISKARSHSPGHESDKKVMETKLLELNEQVATLQENVRKLEEEKEKTAVPSPYLQYEQQIKTLKMDRNKLEAQIKIGLDSLRMEQERVRLLEAQLSQQTNQVPEA